MNKPDKLDDLLKKADPAARLRAPKLADSLIEDAAKAKPSFSLFEQFALLSSRAKQLAGAGAITASAAAAVAVALVVSYTPQPIITLAGMQGVGNAEASRAMDSMTDKMWAPYQSYEFIAGSGLSNETGRGKVYKLVRQGDPETSLQQVAAIFGVSGQVNKYPDFNELAPGYFFGQSTDPWGYDGENPVISLWWSGTASWNYSNPIAYPEASCEATAPDGICTSWREIEPTPELLPTREAAIAKALEIFNATGLRTVESDLIVDYSEWGVNISSALVVDAQDTNIEWYVGWASNGQLSYAGGHFVKAELVGEFDTISEVAAVERLADWRWSGAPPTSFYQQFQPQVSFREPMVRDNSVSSESTAPDEGSGTDSSPGTGEVIEPGFIDQPMEPEIVTLTVERAEKALLSIWDSAGDVWLVPGFIMINDQGWFNAVISLIDGIIALPKESEVGIMPTEDLPATNK